jgi:hypothetical protein
MRSECSLFRGEYSLFGLLGIFQNRPQNHCATGAYIASRGRISSNFPVFSLHSSESLAENGSPVTAPSATSLIAKGSCALFGVCLFD